MTQPNSPQAEVIRTVTLPVEGMNCASCVGRVERALKAIPGVAGANVNLATERAEVTMSAQVAHQSLVEAVEGAGYTVPERAPIELAVGGMNCASCVGKVERALNAVPGVAGANVNLATERALVELTADVDPSALIEAVRGVGKTARLLETVDANQEDERRTAEAAALKRDLVWAAILALPVFALEMGSHLVPPVHHLIAGTIGIKASWWLQFALTTAVLFGPGRRFFTKGIPALWRLAPDMNSLVAVGTLAAWSFSVVATFAPSLLPEGTVHVYFEAAAVIVTLILLGRHLEARAKGRTSEAIQRLVGLQPKIARADRKSVV